MTYTEGPLTIFGLEGIPEVHPGDDLAVLIATAADGRLQSGDVLVVAQKVVSKAEGALRKLAEVQPTADAQELAEQLNRDPRLMQVVLDETVDIINRRQVLVVETKQGFVCVNAGVDRSNVVGEDEVTLLPVDCDASAQRLREDLRRLTGADLAVIISDTFGRPWRTGLVNVALGVAGMSPLVSYVGQVDDYGRPLTVTMIAAADELAAAAELVSGKINRMPAVVIRGFRSVGDPGSGQDLVRPRHDDMFR